MSSVEIIPAPTVDELRVQRDLALGQLRFARKYTLQLLENVEPELWSISPEGVPSNLAWQVGHLAVSQYGLMLFRQRGREPSDIDLVPSWFRKRFGRGSNPLEPSSQAITPHELLQMLSAIDEQGHKVVSELPIESFAEPTEMPYAVYPYKIGALLFCPLHEALHSGQIGLIRRLLGKTPVR